MNVKNRCIVCNSLIKHKLCKKKKCCCKQIHSAYELSLCIICFSGTYPFTNIDDDSLRSLFIEQPKKNLKFINQVNFQELNNVSYDICDQSSLNKTLEDLDPDVNFYSHIKKSLYYTHSEFNQQHLVSDFSILHLNCRSIRKNFNNFQIMLQNLDKQFDFIAISESWLNNDDDIKLYNLPEYNMYCTHRTHSQKGGGVVIYVNDKYSVKQITSLSISESNYMESLALEIDLTCQKINLACIYKPPSTNVNFFTDKFMDYIDLLTKKHTTYICGDFNIDLLKYESHKDTKFFIDQMFSSGLFPLINKPTRITQKSSTLIDNIWCNSLSKSEDNTSGIIIDDVSDHLPIFHLSRSNLVKQSNDKCTEIRYSRKENDSNVSKMLDVLCNYNWDVVLQEKDVNKAYNNFTEIYQNIYNKCCPLVQIKSKRKDSNKPWMTNGLLNACKKKNLLYKHFLINKDLNSEARYKKYKNKLQMILRNTEKKYYSELLNACKNDMKKTWNVINSVLNRSSKTNSAHDKFVKDGHIITGKHNISNEFNDYFVNIGSNLAQKIDNVPNSDYSLFMSEKVKNSMYISPISELEILDIVKRFKNKTSKDINNICMITLKKLFPAIVVPFTHICNLSLANGIFPDQMKIAKVIPIFKSGNIEDFGNYRPISLLSQFSKILEKVFYIKLMSFVGKNNIISNSQYGFRANHSTAYAISDLVESISDALDDSHYAAGIFIDLRKAFDTVDHQILKNKLKYYGIRGPALKWIESYLFNRSQYVNYNNTDSKLCQIKFGVPQGSILGPLLFLLYINDICNISKILKVLLFADDTNLLCSGKNLEILIKTMNSELEKLSLWFKINKMSLNIEKTNFMLFGNKKCVQIDKVLLDNNVVTQVTDTKFLGVLLDNELNWKKHIGLVENKVSKGIGILYKMKDKLDNKSLYMLYSTLILPYINYCSEIWGNTCASRLEKLVCLQKKALRIVDGKRYKDHTNPIFVSYNCLKLKDIVELKTCTHVYKADKGLLPHNVQKRFSGVKQIHSHNTRQVNNLFSISSKKHVKKMCLSIHGVEIYNSLSDHIKTAKSVLNFKRRFKNDKFKTYKKDL